MAQPYRGRNPRPINLKETQVEQITIAGKTFNVPVRYEEGHELTAGEASALNQTYHENIRNNMAKKVKEAEEAGAFNQDEMQRTIDQYANEYQFGVRVAGAGVTRDPVKSEAMRIAKKQLGEMLRKAGKKIGDYEVAAINVAGQKLIDKDPQIMELARQRVEEQKSLAQQDLGDILGGLTEKPATDPNGQPGTGGTPGEAEAA